MKDEWHYLEISRGRYLCEMHGGFCDSCDGHHPECQLCEPKKRASWSVNNVDRGLQIVRGLQGRSQRSLTVVTSALGALGVISILGEEHIRSFFANLPGCLQVTMGLSVLLVVASVICYLLSMAHMPVTNSNKFMSKSMAGWEAHIAAFLNTIEFRHKCGSILFSSGVAMFCLSSALGRVSDLLCMSNSVHASPTKEHDNDDYHQGTFRRAAERR